MIERLLHLITNYLPARTINDGNTPYLERYYIGTLLGWRFYLHRFVGSDPDRGLHDHPWRKAFSLILSGWYWEETRSGRRKVRWFNSLTGDTFHRVVLPHIWQKTGPVFHCDPKPCWTLFAHTAGSVKPWGFWREYAFIADTPLPPGTAVFEQYRYTREGSQKDWWLTAPTGKELRNAAATAHP